MVGNAGVRGGVIYIYGAGRVMYTYGVGGSVRYTCGGGGGVI